MHLPPPPSPPTRGRRIFRALLALVGAAAVGLFLFDRLPGPPIPVPEQPDRLEPQLRIYLDEQAALVRARPRQAARHARLGMAYAVNGLWTEAARCFTNAWTLDNRQPLALMYCGVAAQELNQLDQAIPVFQEVTRRFPDFAPAFYRLGYALMRAGRPDDAEPAYQRLLALAPREWRALTGLGEIQLRRNRPLEAIPLLEKAIALAPDSASAHHLLGQALRTVGRQEEATLELSLGRNAVDYPMEDDWSRDSSTHMRLLQDQLELARQMMDQGTPQQAVQLLSAASIHHPDNPMLLNQLAAAYNRSQRPDKALLLVDHILTREPGHVPALVTRAFTLQMLDRNDDALAAADRVIKTAPQIAEGHLARANALLALERDAESLAALEEASRLDPSNAEILLEIGDVLWRNLSRLQDARRRYEQARDANPALIPAQVRLAEVHLALQNRAEAERAVNTLRRLAPTSPDLPILEQRLRTASSSPAPP